MGSPRRSATAVLVEEFDELPVARYRLQPQGDEHDPLAPAEDRDRIHQPRLEVLDLDPEDAGGTDRWPADPLDAVGDRCPQAGVADPLELAGRPEPGLNLADGQRQCPSGGGRVGQGGTDASTGLLAQGQFLVGEAGTEQRGGHERPQGCGQAGAGP